MRRRTSGRPLVGVDHQLHARLRLPSFALPSLSVVVLPRLSCSCAWRPLGRQRRLCQPRDPLLLDKAVAGSNPLRQGRHLIRFSRTRPRCFCSSPTTLVPTSTAATVRSICCYHPQRRLRQAHPYTIKE